MNFYNNFANNTLISKENSEIQKLSESLNKEKQQQNLKRNYNSYQNIIRKSNLSEVKYFF